MAYEWTTSEGAGPPRVHEARGPEIAVKAVCAHCNNGWMAALEGEVRPILEPLVRGDAAQLGLDEQVVLARWAAKVAVLVEHYTGESVILSPGDLDVIHAGGSAPAGFHIRLAGREEFGGTITDFYVSSVHAAPIGEATLPEAAQPDGPNAFVATFGLGHAAISVVGGPGIDNPTRWAEGGAFPLMIWPPTLEGITWPPHAPVVRSRDELRAFHEGFFTRIRNTDFPRPDALRHVGGTARTDDSASS